MASNPATIELYRLLVTLTRFWKENEKFISLEECRNVLQDPERLALSRLTRSLRGSRQRPLKNNKKRDNKQGSCCDEVDSPEEGAELSEQADSSEEEVNPSGEEANPSGDPSGEEADSCERTNCASSSNTRRRLPQVSAIDIPYSLRPILKSCNKEKGPRPFFEALPQAFPTDGGLVAAFWKLRRCEETMDILKIHRRFGLRNFYVLAVKYGYYSQKGWRRGAMRVLAQDIKVQHPLSGNVDVISESLRLYVELGRGYDAWVTELGLSGYLVALPLEVSETEYTNRGFRKYIPEEAKRLRALGLDKVVKKWKLGHLGEGISRELEERFRPPRAYTSSNQKRKADEFIEQRRYRPPPEKNQDTRVPPIPVSNGNVSCDDDTNSHQSFEESRRNPTSAADPTEKLAELAALKEAATTSAEDSENSQTNGVESYSQQLNMIQFHQLDSTAAGDYFRSDDAPSNVPRMSPGLLNLRIPGDAGLGAIDQSVDNGFVPRTTEPSAQLNISLVVDSGGNGNMDNHLPPHALGYNPPPESECTTNPNSTRTSHHPLELHYAASGNEAAFVWRNQYESTSSIDEIDADPTMTSTLFSRIDPDPTMSSTLFSRIDPDPTMSSTLFSRIDPDPTMSSTLFSRIDPDPTMNSTLFNSSQVNSNAHTLFERGYLELW
ncbi:hypothetical protein RJZ56_008127 [Blastomyces dermatitidis]